MTAKRTALELSIQPRSAPKQSASKRSASTRGTPKRGTPKRSAPKLRVPTPELLTMVAGRFRALAEPSRLALLHALAEGERTVTELVETVGLSQGGLSKHLQQLHASGFVARRREGLFVYYALADERVLLLCELMCGRLDADLEIAHSMVKQRRV